MFLYTIHGRWKWEMIVLFYEKISNYIFDNFCYGFFWKR